MFRRIITRLAEGSPYSWTEKAAGVWLLLVAVAVALAVCVLAVPCMGVIKAMETMKGGSHA